MAAEETLTVCNMDLFPMETLGETGLGSGGTLEALQSCIDPSILSIFEDMSTIETKGFDAESETTLLTALTEILDNVNDENPSPFDMLPDSDLLSNQKDREQSPLKGILCLSHSLQDKDTLCSTRPSTEKSLFRIQTNSLQRSDGEEEEDVSFTLSPDRHGSCPETDLFGWEGLSLSLPNTFEQESEDGLLVSLGDLVRHMHPYCIPISVENETGEHLLPEGGILLEVVDQGENGEPILAIQNMDLPSSEPLKEMSLENQEKVSDEAEEEPSDSSEHIVVDDEDDDVLPKNKCEIAATVPSILQLDVKNEDVFRRPKENKTKSSSRRKKKKKCKEEQKPKPVEGRVLRSGTVTKPAQKIQKKPERELIKEAKKKKVPSVSSKSPQSLLNSKEMKLCRTRMQTKNTTTASLTVKNEKAAPLLSPNLDTVPSSTAEKNQPECSTSAGSSQPHKPPEQPITPCVEAESSSAAPSVPATSVYSESPTAAASSEVPETTPPVDVDAPLPAPEPKPKSLSLAEYRRLRQQKKPAPVEKQDKNNTKWPTLPELPKELPPIPCLPDPNPKDPRRPNTQVAKREVEEVKPAWQPRGPGAPPTPEALLVPPAYMISSSSKVASTAAVPKPPQTQEPSKLPQKPPTLCSEKSLATANPTVSCESPDSLKPANHLMFSADGKVSGVSGNKDGVDGPVQPQSVSLNSGDHTKICPVAKPSTASGLAPSAPLKTTIISQKLPEVTASTSLTDPKSKSSKLAACSVKPSPAALTLNTCAPKSQRVMLETKKTSTNQKAKGATQELIEAFAGEIGIEAADLTSLLEQFEETQVKGKQCVPEVSGRAAAVGNSRTDLVPEKTVIERLRANELSTAAALTPPATPPHQMWKPLPTSSLLVKSKAAETTKQSPSKVIQIEAQPLPSVRSRSKATPAASVGPDLACMDHDYCLPNKGSSTEEPVKRWNVKQQPVITIKAIQVSTTTQTPSAATAPSIQPAENPVIPVKMQVFPQSHHLEKRANDGPGECSVLETPDASPTRQDSESSFKARSPRRDPSRRSYRRHAASRSPSPRCSPKTRTGGRSRKRRCDRSPSPVSSCSDSCSSRSRSRSCSPPKKRFQSRNSDSSSSCSSRSSSPSPSVSRSPPRRRRRNSYSSSRSGSWSRSRSRSPQRQTQWKKSRRLYSPSYRPRYHQSANKNMEESKIRKEQAIEERRVVYVGKIRETMTQKELRERFSFFGEIEECTLHFRDHGPSFSAKAKACSKLGLPGITPRDNYGFVTFYDTKDAFTAIENGSKLRKPDELPFDLCFGGRRQFCQSSYSDLDSNREYDSLPAKGKFHALDFDTLLKQAQQNLKR